ncbi:MAG: Ig-like domain-containing protein [Myxococcota bacterium]
MSALLRLSLVLAALAAGPAYAACRADGLIVFPAPGGVVPTNVQFILEGVGAEQSRIADLAGTDAIALTAPGEDAVQVRAERGWVSQEKRIAIRLKPKKPLKPNTEYTLQLGAAFAGVPVINDALGDNSLRWTTGPNLDKAPPKFRTRPSVAEGFYVQDKDGGLTRLLKLRSTVDDVSPVYLLITMQRVSGSQVKQVYPVPLDGGELKVGHDACSGTFGFDDGRAYRLTFELFDAAGNRSAERGKLDLSAPKKAGP